MAADEDAKKKMRDLSGNPEAVPPQIFNGDTYCGVSIIVSLTILKCGGLQLFVVQICKYQNI